jgi:phage terminase large subunit-like protein
VDELAAFGYRDETWDNLLLGLRLADPRVLVTTTPKPVRLIRELLGDAETAVVRGSTYENLENLAPLFARRILQKYEGTRTGRQEIYAELLEEAEGALWNRAQLEQCRVKQPPTAMDRVVIAIDPAVTSTEESDETGIIAAGVATCYCKKKPELHGFVLGDVSGRYTPDEWATAAVDLMDHLEADRIVAEVNNGGDLVEFTLRTVRRMVPYTAVHASRGKRTRAEPVAALYEQGKIHHVGDCAELEDQLCGWEPLGDQPSPDRLDALVWAFTELMLSDERPVGDYGVTL